MEGKRMKSVKLIRMTGKSSANVCSICGYTVKKYKDKKLQDKMIELHVAKNHPE